MYLLLDPIMGLEVPNTKRFLVGTVKSAALAVWQERLGHVLGLGKLASRSRS